MTRKQPTENPDLKLEPVSVLEIVRHLKLSQQMPSVLTGLVNQKIIEHTVAQEIFP